MAGHSKWANIKHRKGAQDAKRSKIFAKISKEIMVAVSKAGPDLESNPSLRLILSKARIASMPKANIEKAISRAIGSNDGKLFQEYWYGANINGVSFIISLLSDNSHKVASLMQSYINRMNGSLTNLASVSYVFERMGIIAWNKKETDNDDEMMLFALEIGGQDFEIENNVYYVYTNPSNFSEIKHKLEENNITDFVKSEVSYIPNQEVELPKEKEDKILQFIDKLEDEDDVQNIYHNLNVQNN